MGITLVTPNEGSQLPGKSAFRDLCQGPLNGGVFKRGGFPIWTFPSFFVLFCPFLSFWDFPGDFPDLLRDGPGIFPICPFPLSRLLRAPTRNSPERVRDTIWTCPEKSGKHPGLETPRFSFSQLCAGH